MPRLEEGEVVVEGVGERPRAEARRAVAVAPEAHAVPGRVAHGAKRVARLAPPGVEGRVDVDEVDRPAGMCAQDVEVVRPDDQARGRASRRGTHILPHRTATALCFSLEDGDSRDGPSHPSSRSVPPAPGRRSSRLAPWRRACSSNNPAVARRVRAATVGVGPSPASVCNFATQRPVARHRHRHGRQAHDGAGRQLQAGASVNVSCTVTTAGGGFDLNLYATRRGSRAEA